jgi:tetratricopeptide (TPR) repeat protein
LVFQLKFSTDGIKPFFHPSGSQENRSSVSNSPEESPTPLENENAASSGANDADASAQPTDETKPTDGLPEVEPLTPELVEDEALRGDFMLRVFVLMLVVLVACTEIAETSTLVHVKTGQYLSSHGGLPPKADVFSATAAGRPWINLSWLFDLTIAGAFAIAGAKMLTVLKAIIVAGTFFLMTRCVRPDVSTWWGSIAAALALLACHPYFTALPEVVTLLGLAAVLWILYRWRAAESNRNSLWLLVPIFVLWANLDNRMFLGLSLLALYAIGDLIGSLIGVSGLAQSERRRQLWIVLAACMVAACLNPFGWQALAEPARLYGIEYPAFRINFATSTDAVNYQYLPLFRWSVIQRPHIVAGLVLMAAALLTLLLNRRQFDLGHAFVLLGFAGFATIASHELAAAAVVACVVATLNGQDWYRDRFLQIYSVEFRERLFSSGGRALTVVAMVAIAFLATSGRLNDPAGRRIGWGFHPDLLATIDGLKGDIEDSFDDHPFNFRATQGDLLIWLGQKPFVDSRLALYAGTGQDDLLSTHRKIRQSLRVRVVGQPYSGRSEIWKHEFDRFHITHVLPRLSGLNPDYDTLYSLYPPAWAMAQSPDWTMTRFGSMTASMYRADIRKNNKKLDVYLEQRTQDLVVEAFRQKVEVLKSRPSWPQATTTFQRILYSPRHVRPATAQKSLHFDFYIQQLQNPATGQLQVPRTREDRAAAAAHLAIRFANQALVENPDSPDAFYVLGNAYSFLMRLEIFIVGSANFDSQRRYRQAIAAYSQASQIAPDRAALQYGLFLIYLEKKKVDLARRAIQQYDQLTDFESDKSKNAQTEQTRILDLKIRLTSEEERQLRQIDVEVAKGSASKGGTNMFNVAQFAYGMGCVLRALELLEQDPTSISERPDAQIFYALMLQEVGRVQEAADILQRLEGLASQVELPPGWQSPAAWARMANGNYEGAIRLWTARIDEMNQQQIQPMLIPLAVNGPSLSWTVSQSQTVANAISRVSGEAAQTHFEIGLTQLEAGQLEQATESFRKMVQINPSAGNRRLAEFYHFQLTTEPFEMPLPLDQIPLDPGDMFTPEEVTKPDETGKSQSE